MSLKQTPAELNSEPIEPKPSFVLDLGIGSLLQEKTDNSVSQPKTPLESCQSQCPYEEMFSKEDFSGIVTLSEQNLRNSSSNSEQSSQWLQSQSWWIVAQLQLRNFPLLVLRGPMDSAIELASSLFKDSKSVVSGFDRAFLAFVESLLLQKNLSETLQILKSSVALLQIETIQTKLKEICDNYLNDPACFDSDLEKEAQEIRLLLGMPKIVAREQKDLTVSNSEVLDRIGLDLNPNVSNKLKSKSGSLRVLLLLLASIAAVSISFLRNSEESLLTLLRSKIESPQFSLQLPQLHSVDEISELDLILYEVGEKLNAPKIDYPELQAAVQKPSSTKLNTITPNSELESNTIKKIAIDTSGPKEDSKVRDLRTSKPKNELESESIKVPGPAIAPIFKEFGTLRLFEVVRATSLMSSPSLQSEAVAGLNKGDLVQVQGQQGYWYRLISKNGKVAYVLIEDVQPSY